MRTGVSRRGWRRRGLSIAEVVVSTLLIGMVLTAALASVGAAARTTTAAAEGNDALSLAKQLLEEMNAMPYEDGNQTPVFGLESGESAGAGVRNLFDDLDDYNDWTDSPPKDRAGVAISGFTGWTRVTDVQKVGLSSYTILPDPSTDPGLRLIQVTVTSPTGRTRTLQAYRARAGGALQPQGVDQTLVTWVGVNLQVGSGNPVFSGVSVLNHAGDQ